MRRRSGGLGLAFLAGPLLILAACRGRSGVREGPIVLITCDSLRADVVDGLGVLKPGERGLTPNLEALIREATWAGPAVATSSSDTPAMASLLTGLGPWQHQVLLAETPRLATQLETLAEALQRRGYRTYGFVGNDTYSRATGFGQGFDELEPLGKEEAAIGKLSQLGSDKTFVWIHVPEPQAPYLRRPKVEERLGPSPFELPQRLLPNVLATYFDPAEPLPPGKLRRFWAMYRYNVAFADERIGRILAALRKGGSWDRTLIAVTASHGEEFGEKGQILNGGNLGRSLIEVPLIVKLPRGERRPIALGKMERPAATRLWATLVEAAGGSAPAAAAPSLFRKAAPGALSELYRTNGSNRFSWVEGDLQLLREVSFAPPEPDYYRALLARMARGNALAARAELREPPEVLFARLDAAFARVPPLSGAAGAAGAAGGAPAGPPDDLAGATLERWTVSGTEALGDPRRAAAMSQRLERAWGRFQPTVVSPERERSEWYTAESH